MSGLEGEGGGIRSSIHFIYLCKGGGGGGDAIFKMTS